MSVIKHTALPWKFTPWHIEEDAASVRAPEGWAICFTSSDANAEFIVKACNAYYGNQSELAKLREENERLREQYSIFRADWVRYQDGDPTLPFSEMRLSIVCLMEVLDSALKEPTP